MATTKITALTALSARDKDDVVCIVDDPGGTPLSRKITLTDLLALGWGEIYVNAASTATATLSVGVWTLLTLFTANGESLNTTPDHTADTITVANAGKYRCAFNATFRVSGSGDFDFAPHWDGSLTHIRASATVSGASIVHTVGAEGIVDVTSGSTDFDLRVRADTARTVTVVDANLLVQRIH